MISSGRSDPEALRELFAKIRRVPGMFLVRLDYSSLFAYFTAYVEPEVAADFQAWMGKRHPGEQHLASTCLVAWEACAPRRPAIGELSPEDDAASVAALFQLLGDFLAERAAVI